jgi:hypothetical protein
MIDVMELIVVTFAILSAAFFAASVSAIRKRRFLRLGFHILSGLLFLSSAGLFATISIATQGYRALTREEVAAVVDTEPTGEGRFRARFHFPDGTLSTFDLAGDALYVDAHILKWQPIANLLGLHTSYELDRVTGRYTEIRDEQHKPRTVFSLAKEKPVNMFDLRKGYPWFYPVVDAEYGSATFVPVNRTARFQLSVSTSGLLIREVAKNATVRVENPT